MTQQGHIETQQHEQYFAYVDSLITGHAKPFVQMPSAQIEGIDRTFLVWLFVVKFMFLFLEDIQRE